MKRVKVLLIGVAVAAMLVGSMPARAEEACPYSWDTAGSFYRVFCGEGGL